MLTRTKIAVAAAILIGSASGAVAEEYDVDIFRLVPQTTPASIYNVRGQLERRNATVFTPEEKAAFDRASRLD
jgi:hypothetical protein